MASWLFPGKILEDVSTGVDRFSRHWEDVVGQQVLGVAIQNEAATRTGTRAQVLVTTSKNIWKNTKETMFWVQTPICTAIQSDYDNVLFVKTMISFLFCTKQGQ